MYINNTDLNNIKEDYIRTVIFNKKIQEIKTELGVLTGFFNQLQYIPVVTELQEIIYRMISQHSSNGVVDTELYNEYINILGEFNDMVLDVKDIDTKINNIINRVDVPYRIFNYPIIQYPDGTRLEIRGQSEMLYGRRKYYRRKKNKRSRKKRRVRKYKY